MERCEWCNCEVPLHMSGKPFVWGYTFCSNKCHREWEVHDEKLQKKYDEDRERRSSQPLPESEPITMEDVKEQYKDHLNLIMTLLYWLRHFWAFGVVLFLLIYITDEKGEMENTGFGLLLFVVFSLLSYFIAPKFVDDEFLNDEEESN